MILSIIVPIYNSEYYIGRCLDSLLKLENSDIEILCINDGSTDESEKICNNYAVLDSRVKVINQKNCGVSVARNTGLAEARGKYIAFVDSDDWVDAQMFSEFVQIMEQDSRIDMCIGGAVRSYPDSSEEEMFERNSEQLLKNDVALNEMISGDIYFWYLWGKVFKRKSLEKLRFDEDLTTCEDLDYLWRLFNIKGKIENVWYSSKHSYHYYVNSESLTEGTVRRKVLASDTLAFNRILQSQNEETDKNAIDKIYIRYLLSLYQMIRESYFSNMPELANQYLAEAQEVMRKVRTITDEWIWLIERLEKMISIKDYASDYMNGVFISLRSMLSDLKSEESLYIYGTGIVAQYVTDMLKDIRDFSGYVISDQKPSVYIFRKKPVYHFSELPSGNKTVILAMNKKNQDQVMMTLEENKEIKILKPEIPDHF